MTTANPLRATLTATGKELAAAILEAGEHIKIQQQLARDLAKVLVNTGDDTRVALLELLSQPDPKRVLKLTLRTKADEHLEDWATGTPEDFAHWIKSANFCFHDTHKVLYEMGRKTTALVSHAVQGVRHYRESPEAYTDEQMRNFTLITVAAEHVMNEYISQTGELVLRSITMQDQFSTIEGHDHFNCCSLKSEAIKRIVIASPEKTSGIIRVIAKNGVFTEEAILHLVNGGHDSLVNGAL